MLIQGGRLRVRELPLNGAADRRVPLVHGEKMKSALDKHNKKYEWMVVAGEGHGFRDPKNQVKFYGAVEKFLQQHIGTKN